MFFFHLTPVDNVDSIMRSGLIPGRAPEHHKWDDGFMVEPDSVYLAPHVHAAEHWVGDIALAMAQHLYPDYTEDEDYAGDYDHWVDSEVAVFRVDMGESRPLSDFNHMDQWGVDEVVITESISPERLEYLGTVTLQEVHDVGLPAALGVQPMTKEEYDVLYKNASKSFYHVTTADLKVGDVVTPAGGQSPFEGMTDPQYAYACDKSYLDHWENEIKEWAAGFNEPMVAYTYQVEPVGEVIDDPVMDTPGNYASKDGWRVVNRRVAGPIDYGNAESAPRGPEAFPPGLYDVQIVDEDEGHIRWVQVRPEQTTEWDDFLDLAFAQLTPAQYERGMVGRIRRMSNIDDHPDVWWAGAHAPTREDDLLWT